MWKLPTNNQVNNKQVDVFFSLNHLLHLLHPKPREFTSLPHPWTLTTRAVKGSGSMSIPCSFSLGAKMPTWQKKREAENFVEVHPRNLTARPWKMMVGRWVSFWDWLFLGAMLNFRGVDWKSRGLGNGLFLFQIPMKRWGEGGVPRDAQRVHPLGVRSGDEMASFPNDRCLHGTRAPKTNSQIAPKDRPFAPKGNESSSNHWLSGATLLSGRVNDILVAWASWKMCPSQNDFKKKTFGYDLAALTVVSFFWFPRHMPQKKQQNRGRKMTWKWWKSPPQVNPPAISNNTLGAWKSFKPSHFFRGKRSRGWVMFHPTSKIWRWAPTQDADSSSPTGWHYIFWEGNP